MIKGETYGRTNKNCILFIVLRYYINPDPNYEDHEIVTVFAKEENAKKFCEENKPFSKSAYYDYIEYEIEGFGKGV